MQTIDQQTLKSIEANLNKKVTFTNFLAEEVTGYIKGGGIHYGQFAWEISASKNPRTKFNLNGRGNWFIVSPQYVTSMISANQINDISNHGFNAGFEWGSEYTSRPFHLRKKIGAHRRTMASKFWK